MELIRLAKDVFNRKYNPIEYPVTLLGGSVAQNEAELNTFLLMTTLFTYRSGFRQFARTDCTSDKGWGCLIRTCQMMVARCLTLHGQLDLAWFMDVNDDGSPFAIHKFIRWVQNPNEAFDTKFWTPAQGCEAIRNTLIELGSMHTMNRPLTSYVCGDSTIVVEDVQFRLDDGMSVLLLLPTVTGLHRTITQGTYLCLEQLLQVPQCCGIVAGVPNRSYFLIGVSGQRFCFLDPHTTQPAFTNGRSLGNFHENAQTLPAVAWNRIDSSILIGFYISSHSEWDNFVDRLADVKKKAGGVELFSVATKAMLKGGPNARKPASQHLYMRRKLNATAPSTASGTPTGTPGGGAAAAGGKLSADGEPITRVLPRKRGGGGGFTAENNNTDNNQTSTKASEGGGGDRIRADANTASGSPAPSPTENEKTTPYQSASDDPSTHSNINNNNTRLSSSPAPLPTAPHLAMRARPADHDEHNHQHILSSSTVTATSSNRSATDKSANETSNGKASGRGINLADLEEDPHDDDDDDIVGVNNSNNNNRGAVNLRGVSPPDAEIRNNYHSLSDSRTRQTTRSTGGYSSWDDADF